MESKEFFLEELGKFLLIEGFEFRKSKKQFVKKTDTFTIVYGFDFSEYFYMYETVIKIDIHEVEKIKKKAWGKLYRKLATVGQVKTYIISDGKAHLIVTDTQDKVIKALEEEKLFYKNYVNPYIERMTDLNFLDQLLNLEIGKELFVAFNPIHTSFLAIIVAKLVSNPNIEILFNEYRKLVEKHNAHFIEEYDLLVNYVSNLNVR